MKPLKAAILTLLALILVSCRSDDYKKALAAMEAGQYKTARKTAIELKDYKDARTIAAYCHGMEKLRGVLDRTTTLPAEFELRTAFEELDKAGEYRDAPERAQDTLVEILARGYWDNWRHRPFETFPEVWESLDDAHKRTLMSRAAAIIAEETAADVDPLRTWSRSIKGDALRWIALGGEYLDEAGQALYVKGTRDFMLRILDKGYRDGASYAPVREILDLVKEFPLQKRENDALYEAAARIFTDGAFNDATLRKWDAVPGSDPEGWAELHHRIFGLLGDYKDAPDYAKRCKYLLNADFMTEEEFAGEERRLGQNPQKRTVVFHFKQDNAFQDPQFFWQLTKILRFLKQKTLGNLYFTKDPAEAGLVLELSVKRRDSGTYTYVDEQKGTRSQAVYYDKDLTITATKAGVDRPLLTRDYTDFTELKVTEWKGVDKPIFKRNYTAKAPDPYEKLGVGTTSVEAVISEDILNAIRDDLYEEVFSKIEF